MSDTIGTTDHQLVARVALGHVGALAELYDRHASLAYGIALGITLRVPSAEQAVQDTFTRLWHGGLQHTNIAAWIARTARRRAIELTRAETAGETPSPERHATALGALDDGERSVVQLAFFGGRSERQIATSLELPLGTIRSRMASGLGALRGTGAIGSY